ncbi:MAG: hypothetical protein EA380_02730 [Phycisphaeraceae bacterium]|nr:MAG: hypothetical protein EA380_02730 [Phycisphaeraceae bacterium]
MVGRASAGALLAGAVLLASCGGGELRTESEVVEDFAQRVLSGLDFGLSGHIAADAWDAETRTFTGVRIDGSQSQIGTAQRAEVLVNAERRTLVLRVYGVAFADSESGQIVTRDVLVTEPFRVRERFVPDERERVDRIGTAGAEPVRR